MKSFRLSIKAVSPVIATIIIVAIAIVMSIAVAYWMLGLGASFTKYEKVEFTSAYVTGTGQAGSPFVITMNLKNTGSATATVDTANTLYNGKPSSAYAGVFTVTFAPATGTMDPGQTASGTITLPTGTNWVSGMTLELTLHTTGGKDYPKVVVLP